MHIVESTYTTLRAIGKDETWLHHWIVEKPSRLGLGKLTIEHAELTQYQNKGGRLDSLTRAIRQGTPQVMANALTSGKVRVHMRGSAPAPQSCPCSRYLFERRPLP